VLKVNKVFLVTGATGYLAANFLNFIQTSQPDFFEAYDVILLIDRHLKLSRLDDGILENNKIKKIAFDLSQAEEFICLLDGSLSLEVLHFASLNNLEAEKLFIKGLHEFALKTNSLIKFTYLSSSAVYGENDSDPLIPSHENDLLKPVSAYGFYKMQIEKFIQERFRKCFLIIRLANPYGGEFEFRGVYQNFKQQLLDTAMDENFTVKINAEAERQIVRDFVNIRDFCFMLIGLIEANACGIYNVASEKITYLEDFAESVKNDLLNNSSLDLSSSQKRIIIEYQGFKAADIKVSHLSARKLRDCLQARISA
jgi:nucleoside-diphosphate-sugar epimerase